MRQRSRYAATRASLMSQRVVLTTNRKICSHWVGISPDKDKRREVMKSKQLRLVVGGLVSSLFLVLFAAPPAVAAERVSRTGFTDCLGVQGEVVFAAFARGDHAIIRWGVTPRGYRHIKRVSIDFYNTGATVGKGTNYEITQWKIVVVGENNGGAGPEIDSVYDDCDKTTN